MRADNELSKWQGPAKFRCMQEINPYQPSPSAGQFDLNIHGGGLSTVAVSNLARTKPWVYFLGVAGIVIAAILVLGGLGISFGGAVFKTASKNEIPFPMGVFIAMGAGMAAVGVLVTVVSVKLFGYGSAISAVQSSGAMQDLERALDRQRGAWKFFGLTLLAAILLYLVLIVGAVTTSYQSAMQRASRPSPKWDESGKGSKTSGSIPVETSAGATPDATEP